MSEQEQKLIRLQSWDDYQAAKATAEAVKAKLTGMARLMSKVATRLMGGGPIEAEDLANWPSREDVASVMEELKSCREHLKQCRAAARNFGFPVEDGDK